MTSGIIQFPTSSPPAYPGSALTSALNTAFQATATLQASGSAPTSGSTGLPSTANLAWLDLVNNVVRVRNQADSAWLTASGPLGDTNPTTQVSGFTISSAYKFWPVNLASGGFVVTLPTTFPIDFEVVLKAINQTGGPASGLTASGTVDGQTTLIQTAGGFSRLHFSALLGTWSIVG